MKDLRLKPDDFYVYQYRGNKYFYSDYTKPPISKLKIEVGVGVLRIKSTIPESVRFIPKSVYCVFKKI